MCWKDDVNSESNPDQESNQYDASWNDLTRADNMDQAIGVSPCRPYGINHNIEAQRRSSNCCCENRVNAS